MNAKKIKQGKETEYKVSAGEGQVKFEVGLTEKVVSEKRS